MSPSWKQTFTKVSQQPRMDLSLRQLESADAALWIFFSIKKISLYIYKMVSFYHLFIVENRSKYILAPHLVQEVDLWGFCGNPEWGLSPLCLGCHLYAQLDQGKVVSKSSNCRPKQIYGKEPWAAPSSRQLQASAASKLQPTPIPMDPWAQSSSSILSICQNPSPKFNNWLQSIIAYQKGT